MGDLLSRVNTELYVDGKWPTTMVLVDSSSLSDR